MSFKILMLSIPNMKTYNTIKSEEGLMKDEAEI